MPRDDFLIPKTDGQVGLTTANTAYQIPANADTQSVAHEAVICNVSTASVYIKAVTGTTGGTKIDQGATYIARLAPSQVLYGYSGTSLQTINYSIFVVA